jgi:anti-repressor protein
METGLQIFENPQFGKVRVQMIDGDPWFCGKDVCEILGYAKPRNAIATHVSEDDALKQGVIDNLGREQEMTFINESGLYSLIFGSTLPIAKEFKRWVTSEVLPLIRKNGFYGNPKTVADIISPQELRLYSQKMIEYCNKVIELESRVEEMKPKVIFADAVAISNTCILIGDLAKLLKQNGIDIGAKRLFEYLRQNGYLMKNSSSKNMPTQKAMDLGLFEVKEHTITKPDGVVQITRTTKVTGKGQVYFINHFLNKQEGLLLKEA